jgi:lipid-binding SYLF domain-containing protein
MRNLFSIIISALMFFSATLQASEGKTTAANAKISDEASIVILKQSSEIPSKRVSKELRDNAKCILVFPQVIKRGLLFVGDQQGEGLVSCRLKAGTWSTPLYVAISAGTWGLQAGIQDASIILFLLDDTAVSELLDPSIKLGTNVNFIAGPVGQSAKIKNQPSAISYIRTTGLFAGVDIAKANVAFMKEKNIETYGEEISNKSVLTTPRNTPDRFTVFISTLNDYAPVPVAE